MHYAKSRAGAGEPGSPRVRTARAGLRRPRRRLWHISPEGFRELRHSCFLSRRRCAEFLGVSLRTVQYWDAGRCRVPWSAVRLLRLRRLGDLGALNDAWSGWTLGHSGLCSPEGREFRAEDMRRWWSIVQLARLWREAYDRGDIGGVGAPPPRGREAVTLQPEAGEAAPSAGRAAPTPIEAASTPTAFSRHLNEDSPGEVQGTFPGEPQSCFPHSPVHAMAGVAGEARSALPASSAGLVISSTSGTRFARSRFAQGFGRMHGR
ncbi:VC1465 family Xer recombination activation factor [Frateuria defendens]|uniref:VC1465 family Xer recombination activation factor n=1 Tax=Frateuria defendens TaxID=2219559 RepID=UPI0009E33B1D